MYLHRSESQNLHRQQQAMSLAAQLPKASKDGPLTWTSPEELHTTLLQPFG